MPCAHRRLGIKGGQKIHCVGFGFLVSVHRFGELWPFGVSQPFQIGRCGMLSDVWRIPSDPGPARIRSQFRGVALMDGEMRLSMCRRLLFDGCSRSNFVDSGSRNLIFRVIDRLRANVLGFKEIVLDERSNRRRC
jgi:hypothetical protein